MNLKFRKLMAGVLFCAQMYVPATAQEVAETSPLETVTVAAEEGEPRLVRVDLNQAIGIALSSNPTIIVAGEEIELKKVANKEAYYGLLPEANFVGSYNRTLKKQTMAMRMGDEIMTIKVGMDNSYSGGLSVSLPLFAPALYKSINLTKTDIALAVEKSRSSKLDMVNQVTKAYYQLLLTQDSYEVLKKSYAQAEANFNVINEMYRVGSVSEYDKIRADVQVRSLKPNVVSASNGVNLAKLQLKVLMGLDDSVDIEIEGNLTDYEQEMFERRFAAGELNLENNSDLKQLDLNADMLEQTLKLQKTSFMPTLAANYSYMYTSLNDNFKFSEYKWFPYSFIGFNLNIPLFKGSNFTKMKQTRIQMNQLREMRINTERMLYMQINSYLNNMSASTEQVLSNKESVLQAEKGRMIAQKRYEVGKGTFLELNDSEVALTQAQLTYNQSIYDYLTAKADLEKVIGHDEKIKTE